MSTTLDAPQVETLRLPDVKLSELPEATKDYLIAASLQGKSVATVIREALNRNAVEHGFNPNKEIGR